MYQHGQTCMVRSTVDLFKDGVFSQVHPDDISPLTHYWDYDIAAFVEILTKKVMPPEKIDYWHLNY